MWCCVSGALCSVGPHGRPPPPTAKPVDFLRKQELGAQQSWTWGHCGCCGGNPRILMPWQIQSRKD